MSDSGRKVITVYVSKYALTEGIMEHEGEVTRPDSVMVRPTRALGFTQFFHGCGKEWHLTMESALARAEVMRLAKIASLRKAIAKLEKLTFVDPGSGSSR